MSEVASDTAARRHRLHVGVAEAGKVHALARRHREALDRYREAMRLAEQARAPQLFARHYLYCMLDSLEHLGATESVVAIATAAAQATAQAGDTPFHLRDRAGLIERAAVGHLKRGEREAAGAGFAQVVALVGAEAQPLSAQLLHWLTRGLAIDATRLAEAQRRHRYWVVRPGTVDAARAIETPTSGREALHGR
jgi:hypothetical protein